MGGISRVSTVLQFTVTELGGSATFYSRFWHSPMTLALPRNKLMLMVLDTNAARDNVRRRMPRNRHTIQGDQTTDLSCRASRGSRIALGIKSPSFQNIKYVNYVAIPAVPLCHLVNGW